MDMDPITSRKLMCQAYITWSHISRFKTLLSELPLLTIMVYLLITLIVLIILLIGDFLIVRKAIYEVK